MSDDKRYQLSEQTQAYIPTIGEIDRFLVMVSTRQRGEEPVTPSQLDAEIEERIQFYERQVVKGHFLQAVRRESKKDKSWLRKVLGL